MSISEVSGAAAMVWVMPRTDENGRQLKALLDYLLDGDVEAKEIYGALGISSSTYYRRIKDSDYPNAEELRLVADRFGLSYPDMQVRFGLMTPPGSVALRRIRPGTGGRRRDCAPDADGARTAPKLSESTPRRDAPPL